jgi:hypothetical protein
MHERCTEEKERVLAGHQPEPLADDVSEELDRVVEAARRELSGV